MRFELGFDEDGNALPDNDASPYTPRQIYVLKKVIGTDKEKAKQFDALTLAKNKKDMRIFVKSLAPKNASFSWGLSSAPWSSTTKLVRDRTEESCQAHGVTFTEEALGMFAGDERILNIGAAFLADSEQGGWPAHNVFEGCMLRPQLLSRVESGKGSLGRAQACRRA